MKEIENDIIKKYSYKDYVVYIKETKNNYEYYLQNEDYGVINLIFGVNKRQYKLKKLIDFIKENIDMYIKDYKELYED